MKPPRRRFLGLLAGAAAVPAAARAVCAQAYPARPVRLIVGFAAGGAADIVARLIGQWLSERLRQSFIIENRPGAGSNTAAETVVKAPPDGYTLLHLTVSNAINATLYEKLAFRYSARHRAGREHLRLAGRDGGQSRGSGRDGRGVHRLCQGASGPDQHGVGRQRQPATPLWRAVQER